MLSVDFVKQMVAWKKRWRGGIQTVNARDGQMNGWMVSRWMEEWKNEVKGVHGRMDVGNTCKRSTAGSRHTVSM